MRCTYEKTIFKDGEFSIIVCVTDDQSVPQTAQSGVRDGKIRFTAKGSFLPESDAVEVDLEGHWETNEYGTQFLVEASSEIIPASKAGILSYLSSGLLKGIGPETAKSIVKRFGDQALDVLEKTPEKLLEIKGITQDRLDGILDSYYESRMLKNIVTCLGPFGITINQAAKIQQAFGYKSMAVIQNTPFLLCSIQGFGYLTVDQIARRLGIRPNDPYRIRAAVSYILTEAAGQGHVYLPLEEVIERAGELLNGSHSSEIVEEMEIQRYIEWMASHRKLVCLKKAVYLPHYFRAESETARYITEMLSIESTSPDMSPLLKEAQAELGIEASDQQAKAIQMVFESPISILTGGPGTGKTLTIKLLLWVFQKQYPEGKILLAAPTGRASRRMAETTGFEAGTLHSALGLLSEYGMGSDEDIEFLDADLVIVDEFSMADAMLTYQLFRRIHPTQTRVLLVGDADQLPSVGPGNVFREIISCGAVPVTILDLIYRQSKESRIPRNAEKIRLGKSALSYGKDFRLLPCSTAEEAAEIIQKQYMYAVREFGLDDVQILSPMKKTEAGVNAINGFIRELVNPASLSRQELRIGNTVYRVGDRLMQTKNRVDVSNGDIGVLEKMEQNEEGETLLYVRFSSERLVQYEKEKLDELLLAYAFTIHKSQGSEWKEVIIPVLWNFKCMLKRNLIYTAVTRARQKIVLVGQVAAIALAIRDNDVDQRYTKLGKWISGFVNRKKKAKGETAS